MDATLGSLLYVTVNGERDAPVTAPLIYPDYPDTFWSFRYAPKFIHRKVSRPPFGLLTISAFIPEG